jgi:hypothetical protein
MPDTSTLEADVVLIGAGIMSATLGVFLRELEPSLRIELFEALEAPRSRVRKPGTTPGPAMPPIAS